MTTSIPATARVIVFQNYETPSGLDLSINSPSSTFAVKELPIPSPIPDDSLLIQTLFLGNEPGVRILVQNSIKFEREDFVKVPLGTPFPPYLIAIGRVVAVGGNDIDGPFKIGDIVQATCPYWTDYAVVKKDKAKPRRLVPSTLVKSFPESEFFFINSAIPC